MGAGLAPISLSIGWFAEGRERASRDWMASEIVEGDHASIARITEGPGDGIRAVDASRILQYLVGRTELTDSGLIDRCQRLGRCHRTRCLAAITVTSGQP